MNDARLDGLTDRERALVEAALMLASRLEIQEACDAVLDVVERVFEAQCSWVLLYDGKADRLTTAAVRGIGAKAYAGAAVRPSEGIVGLAFSTGESVFVPDVRNEERWFDPVRLHDSGLPSVVTVPLVHDEDRIGVIGFYSPRFSAAALPTPADRSLLHGLGAVASLGIKNARLFEAVETERVRRVRLHAEQRQLRHHVGHLREEIRAVAGRGVIGSSAAIRMVLEQASIVAPGDTTVLLLGETGTGKELIARAIHESSRRARGIFVPVNCAAIPASLVESELFGHEKGSFTGATERRTGKFELAHGATLFLDEIGDLPLDAQAKLLRALQEGEIQRVGGTKTIPVDVRVIAATNQDLSERMHAGQFRADLYYRLSVFPIQIPSLRERREDIPELAAHFVAHFARRQHTPTPEISPESQQRLCEYDWPGNVRELQNVLERAVILARGGTIRVDLIPIIRRAASAAAAMVLAAPPPDEETPSSSLAEADRHAIRQALEAAGWRISGKRGAAELLGVKPTTLHAKMKKLGIRRPGRNG